MIKMGLMSVNGNVRLTIKVGHEAAPTDDSSSTRFSQNPPGWRGSRGCPARFVQQIAPR